MVSERVLVELVRAVQDKMPASLDDLGRLLRDAPPEFVGNPTASEVSAAMREVNPGDAPVWAAAVSAEVDYFVTGDRRLLSEARAVKSALTVLTPRELVDRLAESR